MTATTHNQDLGEKLFYASFANVWFGCSDVLKTTSRSLDSLFSTTRKKGKEHIGKIADIRDNPDANFAEKMESSAFQVFKTLVASPMSGLVDAIKTSAKNGAKTATNRIPRIFTGLGGSGISKFALTTWGNPPAPAPAPAPAPGPTPAPAPGPTPRRRRRRRAP